MEREKENRWGVNNMRITGVHHFQFFFFFLAVARVKLYYIMLVDI